MARKNRQLVDGGVYHVISRGHNKCDLFHSGKDYSMYKYLLSEYKKKFAFKLYHYCLMPNHAHLLLKIAYGDELSRLMQGVNQSYSGHYKRVYGLVGYLFQGRYKGLLIEKDDYLLECGRYIERNPLKAGIVSNLSDYAFSSLGFYINGEGESLLTPNPLFTALSEQEEERRRLYKNYVMQERLADHVTDSNIAR